MAFEDLEVNVDPTALAENPFRVDDAELESKVGEHLGFGSDSVKWSPAEVDVIKRCVAMGKQSIVEEVEAAAWCVHHCLPMDSHVERK